MPVDNDIYNRVGKTWWNDDNPLVMLHGGMTTARMEYFRGVLARAGKLPGGDSARSALDVGSGGGFVSEELHRLGFAVTGVDPSAVSVETARSHAAASGYDIDYRIGRGEMLPAEDARFDVAVCCDVLEHVDDVDLVLAETARVLRPGGIFMFDTINRTLPSRMMTSAMQQWRPTRVIDFNLHDWTMFITPGELAERAGKHGLECKETVGLGPRAMPWAAVAGFVQLRRGKINYRQLGDRLRFGQIRAKFGSYMGYAIKSG